MARYIDADKLIDKLEELQFDAPVMTPVMKIIDVIQLVEDSPTADVVEVVRCKDCIHCIEIEGISVCNLSLIGKPIYEVLKIGGVCWAVVKPEDFCSNGQRKEGE